MSEVELKGQVVLDLIHQPLVVEVREHKARRLDKELDGGDVSVT
jgi:hypothetical protein